MEIDQEPEQDYESATVEYVGFVDPYAVEGLAILRADDQSEFHMRAFSGEVAKHIMGFMDEDSESFPTVYKMIEDICEHGGIYLVKVKIYQSGQVLRANLHFAGRQELVLRNYKASDALALAVYYNIPILIRKGLFQKDADA